jgi:hypothetical protein
MDGGYSAGRTLNEPGSTLLSGGATNAVFVAEPFIVFDCFEFHFAVG